MVVPFPMRTALCILLSLTAALASPNVIVVMTDDQGHPELSCHGNPVLQTPNLDRLHAESLRLTDFHVAPMCTPTRGQLLTGLDAARNGAINVSSGHALLRPGIRTMGDHFSRAGRSTGLFGKWHLGSNHPLRPEDRGFDQTVWFPSSHIGSVPDFWGNDYFDDTYVRNGRREAFEGYCADVFFSEAMAFMKRCAEGDRPFLALITPNTPHGPLVAPEEDREELARILAAPAFSQWPGPLRDTLSRYLGMVRNIDRNMGRLMEFLRREGLEQDTILVFLTDNGSTFGPRYYNAGMRGRKTQLWEGGHRVPCFIRWPGGGLAPPQDIGGLTQVQDLLPTLLDLCDLPFPEGLDGTSLAPILRGRSAVPEDRMLVVNYSRMPIGFDLPSPWSSSRLTRDGGVVLWKRWRLVEDRALYDLDADPLQRNDVAAEHPRVLSRMRDHLDRWWDEVRSQANRPVRIPVGSAAANPVRLTACEWLNVFVDQQRQVRRGERKLGYWLLRAARPGTYRITLRRWPAETGWAIAAGTPAGEGRLAIRRARIHASSARTWSAGEDRPGFPGLVRAVGPEDTEAAFTLQLPRGPFALHAWFEGDDLSIGAYYAEVERL